jgi:hypothetical protein
MWIKPLKYNAAKEKRMMEVSREILVPEVGRLRGAGLGLSCDFIDFICGYFDKEPVNHITYN